MNKIERNIKTDFYKKVSYLLRKARQSVVQTINQTMVFTYFEIGKMIVEEEQKYSRWGSKSAIIGSQKRNKLKIFSMLSVNVFNKVMM